ncbi:MAG TPA: MYXO-CTERM sorting domain-containing protein [Nannocystaceae bacterium]|nr:MYXO-CTERM sorting domain-containing protein [Nannocystaceae bacterium]
MRRIVLPLALALAALAPPSSARAGVDACGDIHVEASAMCEVLVGDACVAKCEPVNFTAACAAKLEADCSGMCTATAMASCTGTCEADCQAACMVDPGSYECEGSCDARCVGSCDAECSASADKAQCRASCEATCDARCSGSCQGTPPEATCDAKCSASCEGHCEAEANMKCQVDCQANGYANCTSNLQGGCEVRCQKPEGALFCDGQYVDHDGNLQECIDALNAFLDAHVDASGSASCSGNSCQAEGEVTCNCDVDASPTGGLLATLGLGILGVFARRRRA